MKKIKQKHPFKHGDSGKRLNNIWKAMRNRCNNPNFDAYSYYGGKGVSVDPTWNEYVTFRDWALSNGYSDELTIDRIDNDGNYEPSNCRWATLSTQQRTKSLLYKNNTTGYRGVSFEKRRGMFVAGITIDGKRKFIQYANTAIEAAKAYNNYVIDNKLEHRINEKSMQT